MAIYTLGIDVGSTASKCIMLKDGKEIVSKSLVSVGTGTSGPQRAIEEVLKNAGKTREDMDYTLATGYGRNSLEGIADKQMSELSCHAKGAFFLFPKVHTVIDIGGQDVKVLKIENGAMVNFQMNDKCAAGTGRLSWRGFWRSTLRISRSSRQSPRSASVSVPPARSLRRVRLSASSRRAPTSGISLRAFTERLRAESQDLHTAWVSCRTLL